MNAKTIGEQAADMMTREVHWPFDDDWRNLLSGEVQIDRENPEATVEAIIGAADSIFLLNEGRFMVDKRREAKAGGDSKLVNAIDEARGWIAELKVAIKDPEFDTGVRAWVMDYIAD